MAIIPGVTVNWQLSPRVIFIPNLYEEITIRDLQDTLKDLEDDVEGILWTDLRATSGGEDLGGGVSVGWTMELQNAVIAPAPRQESLQQGTATTADSDGIILIDNAASFITNGIVAGASVLNYTDGSVSSIIAVDSETQVRMIALDDGTNNDWEVGDVYKAWNEVQFNITGGNLVAVDEFGVTTTPLLSTWGNEILKTSSASATTQELGAIQYSSFQGAVTIDVVNGTAGTEYPIGTAESPSNNLADAHDIAEERGFSKFNFIDNFTFDSSVNYSDGYEFWGQGLQRSAFTFEDGCQLLNSEIYDATCIGTVSGVTGYESCKMDTLAYSNVVASSAEIQIHESQIHSIFTIADNFTGSIIVTDCWALPDVGSPPIYDMNDADCDVQVRNLSGFIQIQNCTDASNDVRIFLHSGGIELASTVSAGNFLLTGVGSLLDNSGPGANVNSKDLLQASRVTNIKYAVESLRPHHTGTGNMYFWDPENGDDARDGTVETLAKKTFAAAYGLAENGNHDVITCISSISGQTVVDEQITLDKNYTFLRGPGRDFKIDSSHSTLPAITITGVGVEVSSIIVDTNSATTANAIEIQSGADFCLLESIWSDESGEGAVHVDGDVAYTRINDCFISNAGDHGIHLNGNVSSSKIEHTEIYASSSDGIKIEGALARDNIIGNGMKIYNGGGYGINILSPATRTFIDLGAEIYDTTSGNILDNGIDTQYGVADIAELNWTAVYLDVANGFSGTNYPVGTPETPSNNLTDAFAIAAAHNIITIAVSGALTLDQSSNAKEFVNWNNGSIDLNGQSSFVSIFRELAITGSQTTFSIFYNCRFTSFTGLNGSYVGCYFNDALPMLMATGATINFDNCRSMVPGNDSPIFDFTNGGISMNLWAYSGGIRVINSTDAANIATFEFIAGKFNFPASNTAGYFAVRGIVDETGIDSSATATVALTGATSSPAAASAVWDTNAESGVTTLEAIQTLLATLAGEASGGGTSTIEFKNPAGDTTRVTMTVDTSGNRSAVTLTP